jgi:monofunctional biosynthetic peptidoglycan transglycosylase
MPSPIALPPKRYTWLMVAKRKRGCRRWLLWPLVVGLTAAAIGAVWVALTWPKVAALADGNPETTAFIEAARARGDNVEWRWVPYHQISLEVKKAVIAAEDMSFFSHHGFDTHELRIVAQDAAKGKPVRGASTITQQLAKNLWLSPSRSPLRKVREAVLTWQLERHLSKQRILELYLNVAQFGPETYGVEAAARRFFGVAAGDLDADQAARLAAGLTRPTTWHPGVTSRGYSAAVARIQGRVERCDWLDKLL